MLLNKKKKQKQKIHTENWKDDVPSIYSSKTSHTEPYWSVGHMGGRTIKKGGVRMVSSPEGREKPWLARISGVLSNVPSADKSSLKSACVLCVPLHVGCTFWPSSTKMNKQQCQPHISHSAGDQQLILVLFWLWNLLCISLVSREDKGELLEVQRVGDCSPCWPAFLSYFTGYIDSQLPHKAFKIPSPKMPGFTPWLHYAPSNPATLRSGLSCHMGSAVWFVASPAL